MERKEWLEKMLAESQSQLEHTSGKGSLAIIPQEIRGWNWGAFFWGWLWGVSNKVWISLLTIIPFIGFIMLIVLGIKGNEWAWQKRRWDSIEHFKRTQSAWAWWGLGILVVYLGMLVGVIIFSSS